MRSFLAALALLAASCTGCHPTPPPVTPGAGDAGTAVDAAPAPPVPAVVSCTPADAHRRSLGCADQSGFLALCMTVNDQRFADCIAAAPSCKAMDGCDPALLAGAKRHP